MKHQVSRVKDKRTCIKVKRLNSHAQV